MIYLATDHAGYELKEVLKTYLTEIGQDFEDCGPDSFNRKDDYPDYIIPAMEKVASHQGSYGIILGGSGQGEGIAANKVKGIRATVYYGGSMNIIRLSKTHNNANVLSLGARFISQEKAKKAVKLWLETSFSGVDRHTRRINKITAYEK